MRRYKRAGSEDPEEGNMQGLRGGRAHLIHEDVLWVCRGCPGLFLCWMVLWMEDIGVSFRRIKIYVELFISIYCFTFLLITHKMRKPFSFGF